MENEHTTGLKKEYLDNLIEAVKHIRKLTKGFMYSETEVMLRHTHSRNLFFGSFLLGFRVMDGVSDRPGLLEKGKGLQKKAELYIFENLRETSEEWVKNNMESYELFREWLKTVRKKNLRPFFEENEKNFFEELQRDADKKEELKKAIKLLGYRLTIEEMIKEDQFSSELNKMLAEQMGKGTSLILKSDSDKGKIAALKLIRDELEITTRIGSLTIFKQTLDNEFEKLIGFCTPRQVNLIRKLEELA